ncbi:unnamed protein product, partial [Amoebophrya sp. A120]
RTNCCVKLKTLVYLLPSAFGAGNCFALAATAGRDTIENSEWNNVLLSGSRTALNLYACEMNINNAAGGPTVSARARAFSWCV